MRLFTLLKRTVASDLTDHGVEISLMTELLETPSSDILQQLPLNRLCCFSVLTPIIVENICWVCSFALN